MSPRYWFDSFPGIEVETVHPILDYYGTPFGGPEWLQFIQRIVIPFDAQLSHHSPYTTVSQNRGGPS